MQRTVTEATPLTELVEANPTTTNQQKQDFSNQTNEELNEQLTNLYWESWKCFGLKLTIPLIPVITTLTVIGIIFVPAIEADHKEEDRFTKYNALKLPGFAGLSLFCCTLGYAKMKHKEQQQIDEERSLIKNELTARGV